MALKLRARWQREQVGGAADKKAGRRGNAILPTRAPASFKRLLGGLRLRLHRPAGARRLNNHIYGGQQADQDDRIQYEEQGVARPEVEGGQHQYDEGTRDDSVEVVPIVSCAHKLEDEAA